ncbi:MAG: sodium-dependent transporter [Chloroflexi bacterium]|nr:sodium-dependent transporter [Chloroflexota bacterium]
MESQAKSIRFERWSSSKGFLAATIGSAVGLGNIWRFPYMAGENGGGTFLIPYFVGILLCGIPLMTFEIAAGRRYRSGIIGAVQAINPRFWVLGAAIALIGFIFLSYYLVITGWTLSYLVSTPLARDTDFNAFSNSWAPLAFFLIATAIAVLIVGLGIAKGIERVSKVLLPLLAVILVLIAAYGLTLSGRAEAVRWTPKIGQVVKIESRS